VKAFFSSNIVSINGKLLLENLINLFEVKSNVFKSDRSLTF